VCPSERASELTREQNLDQVSFWRYERAPEIESEDQSSLTIAIYPSSLHPFLPQAAVSSPSATAPGACSDVSTMRSR
jgi:hypothetical protein